MAGRAHHVVLAGIALVALGLVSGCSRHKSPVPSGILEGDRYLFDRATELIGRKKWLQAREHYRQLVDNYPQSNFRPDAKLGLGDTYLGENTIESLVLAQNEYREFLTFYPTNARADYAQFKLGMCHFQQVQSADRDQTETKEAVAELTLFVQRYPQSSLLAEGQQKLREARTRLTDSQFHVGYFYYRTRWFPGAVDRFKAVLKDDPEFPHRDAVYYYLGDALLKAGRRPEGLPYLDRAMKDFPDSAFAVLAKRSMDAPDPALVPNSKAEKKNKTAEKQNKPAEDAKKK
jgi:outer membrane protein assembly factor BamD